MADYDEPGSDEPWEPDPAPVARRRDATPEGVRIIGAEEARAAIEGGQVQRRLGSSEPRYGDVPERPAPAAGPTVRLPLPGQLVDDEIIIERSPEPGPGARPEPVAVESDEPTSELEFGAGLPEAPPLHVIEPVEPIEPSQPTVRIVPATPSAPVPPDDASTGPVELPHWTEPPTGEVARIRPESAHGYDEAFGYDDGGDDLEAWASLSGSQPRFRDDVSDWSDEDYTPTGERKDLTAPVAAVSAPVEDDDVAFEREVAARRRATRRRGPDGPEGPGGGGGGGARRSSRSEAEPDDDGTAGGRNLPVAVATGVGVAVVAVVCMLLGAPWVLALATLIIAMAALELFDGLRRAEYQPATLLGLLGAVTLLIAGYHRGPAAYPLVLMLMVVFTMLWYLAEVVRARPVPNIGATLLGFGYVGVLGSFAGLILAMPWSVAGTELGTNDGVGIILGLALCAVGSDVVAYFVGSRFGRTKITPRISPNKSLEGLIAGAVASILIAVLIVGRFSPWDSLGSVLALGVVVAVMAPLGDLFESMIKRDLGIKDLGTILPGHGGVLDRFDSILICLPAVYYLARALFG